MQKPQSIPLNGVIDPVATAEKAHMMPDQRQRELLFMIQGLSMSEDSWANLEEWLMASKTALTENRTRRRFENQADICAILEEQVAGGEMDASALEPYQIDPPHASEVSSFLRDLCLNYRLLFTPPGAEPALRNRTFQRAEHMAPQATHSDPRNGRWRVGFVDACLPTLPGIIEALYEYLEIHRARTADSIHWTANGRAISTALEHAAKTAKTNVVVGREGRGKSESARVWCQANLGRARFVELRGMSSRTSIMRATAEAFGIPNSHRIGARKLQAMIELIARYSGLMVVVDEAHQALPQGRRVVGVPDVLDWWYTAFSNQGVPLVLMATERFGSRISEISKATGWNFMQFKRRIRWITLEQHIPRDDLFAISRKLLPGLGEAAHKITVGYAAGVAKRDVSGLVDLVEDAKATAESHGRQYPTLQDLKEALMSVRLPEDEALDEALPAPTTDTGSGAIPPASEAEDEATQGDCTTSADRLQAQICGPARTATTSPNIRPAEQVLAGA